MDTEERLAKLEKELQRLDLSIKLVVASTRSVLADNEAKHMLVPVTREAPEEVTAG